MKTDDLIGLLATGNDSIDGNAAIRRFATALIFGAMGALALMTTVLGVRPDLTELARLPMFWVKIGFVVGLTAASLLAALRLARPGASLGIVPAAVATPVLAIWIIAWVVLGQADSVQRAALVFGRTWLVCPFLIAMLSVPVFIGVSWAMRGLAPTRLRLAGAAAGFLSGTTGTMVYCLHCPEIDAPFLGIWYLLGMLIPTAIGALLGNRLLRW